MDNLSKTIEQSIQKFIEETVDKLDKKTLEELGPEVRRLAKKKEEQGLDLNDVKSLLKIYRNVIIPSAMVHEAQKLRAIDGLVNGAMGIGKPR